MKNELIILCFVAYYLPGYKAGGPIRTMANMVDILGDEFQFKIVTADRDFEDTKPFSDVTVNSWNKVGKAEIYYLSTKTRSLGEFKKVLCSTECDVVYLNSFFSPHFTIKPLLLRWLRLIPNRRLIIAPRGEFSPGALGLKSFKKRIYLLVAKTLALYRGVVWHASTVHEEADIRRWFGRDVPVIVAPNLFSVVCSANGLSLKSRKTKGSLKIIFLSRISRKKNLDEALRILNGLKGEIKFSIYGPLEDKNYWAECQEIISRLPENIEVQYCGSVVHEEVIGVMRAHDLLLFPTLGENFGHVILEALIAGCPVLISDQTPWRDLEEKGLGWDLALESPELFRTALQKCVNMDQVEYKKWSKRAREFGMEVLQDNETVECNRKLFYYALHGVNLIKQESLRG